MAFSSPSSWPPLLGFEIKDAASIGIIGAADGPTSILVSQVLGSNYIGPIAVAAYSYMALVPIIQPAAIKLVTTKKERAIKMEYRPNAVTKTTRILFPIMVTFVAGLVAPASVSLVGFLMFGNLIRECGVLNRLSETAQNDLANLITLLLGITIAFSMRADQFVTVQTIMIWPWAWWPLSSIPSPAWCSLRFSISSAAPKSTPWWAPLVFPRSPCPPVSWRRWALPRTIRTTC